MKICKNKLINCVVLMFLQTATAILFANNGFPLYLNSVVLSDNV